MLKNIYAQHDLLYNQQVYQYKIESIGFSDIKKLYANKTTDVKEYFFNSASLQRATLDLSCIIRKTTINVASDSINWCYQIEDLSMSFGKDVIVSTKAIMYDLNKPFFVTTDIYGIVGNINFEKSVSEAAIGLAKEIISGIQVNIPHVLSKQWISTEQNTIGTYNAVYNIIATDKLQSQIKKSIKRYTLLKRNSFFSGVLFDYDGIATLNKNKIVNTFKASSSQVLLNKKDTVSATAYKINLQLVLDTGILLPQQETLSKLRGSEMYTEVTTLSAPVSELKLNRLVYSNTLGTDTWDILIDKLYNQQALIDEKGSDSLLLKFRALFYLYPNTCNIAVDIISNEPFHTLVAQLLIKALSITESFAATDALTSLLIKQNDNTNLLMGVLPALATTTFPTENAIQQIKLLAFDRIEKNGEQLVSTAQLTVGALAKNMASFNLNESEKVVLYLIDKFKNTQDTLQQILVLGNTGSAHIFPTLKKIIDTKNVSKEFKMEAINALKEISNKEVILYLTTLKKNKTKNRSRKN